VFSRAVWRAVFHGGETTMGVIVYDPVVDGLDHNVLTMVDAIRRSEWSGELFLRRNSWGFMTVFKFVNTQLPWAEWSERKAPYFWEKGSPVVVVQGVIHWGSSRTYERHELRSPGTFAYTPIRRPAWWRDL
jgi:hypothetical protein